MHQWDKRRRVLIRPCKNHPIICGIIICCLLFLCGQMLDTYRLPATSWAWGEAAIHQPYESYTDIPPRITQAVIQIEDRRFWRHPWVDLFAVVRALYQTIIKWEIQWWSTIEQQLIKLSEQHFSRSIGRKIYESWYAINLQFHYSKQEIVTAYINSIPFSHNVIGRNEACSSYFHKWCDYLSDSELSYLFAVAQLGLNPQKDTHQNTIITRAKRVCRVLGTTGLTQKSACSILDTEDAIDLYASTNTLDPKISLFLDTQSPALQKSFSPLLYEKVEQILYSTQTHREQYNAQYCCVMVIDSKGGVVSMNTCSDWEDERAGKVNVCLEPRQVGSAIKPFLYTYAFQSRWLTTNDTIIDEPTSYDLGDGSTYSPKNFDLTFHGEVTLWFALGNSLNVPAIKLLDSVGVDPFLQFIKQQLAHYASWYDTNTKDANNVWLSLALGTYEISPYAFTQLWRIFLPGQMPAGYEKNTQLVADILADAKNKVVSFGQDNFLTLPWRAVKTGTSRKFIDGWVCGAHQEKWLTLCLWMGNVNNEAMKGPSSEVWSYIWSVIAKEL